MIVLTVNIGGTSVKLAAFRTDGDGAAAETLPRRLEAQHLSGAQLDPAATLRDVPGVRARIHSSLEWAGIELDRAANEAARGRESRISKTGRCVGVWVIPVDEELLMVRAPLKWLNLVEALDRGILPRPARVEQKGVVFCSSPATCGGGAHPCASDLMLRYRALQGSL